MLKTPGWHSLPYLPCTRSSNTSKKAVMVSRGVQAAAARLQNADNSLSLSAELPARQATDGSSSSSMSSSTACSGLCKGNQSTGQYTNAQP